MLHYHEGTTIEEIRAAIAAETDCIYLRLKRPIDTRFRNMRCTHPANNMCEACIDDCPGVPRGDTKTGFLDIVKKERGE